MGHEFEFKFFIPCQVTLGAKSNLIVLVTKKNKKKQKTKNPSSNVGPKWDSSLSSSSSCASELFSTLRVVW
jgi:hypothetical protein